MNKDNSKFFEPVVNPRFTTEEMEKSQTRCGCEIKITSLVFDDNKPQFPTKALGCIHTGHGRKIIASWNQNGECTVGSTPIKSFDLIKFDDSKDNEVKPVVVGFEHAVI